MLNDCAARRAAVHDVLAHERADQKPRRGMRLLGVGCLGLAFLGTASTVKAWESSPARQASAIDADPRGETEHAQPRPDGLDFGIVAQIASS